MRRCTTETVVVSPNNPDAEIVERAARILRLGGLVAFPTETVYGLGANAFDDAAVLRIFEVKGRPATNPLIVHVTGSQKVMEVVADWPPEAELVAQRFWPGPLTLVLPKAERIAQSVTAGGPTVALRSPAHPVAQALLRRAGVPLAAPSANRSERLSPTRAEHVLRDLEGRIEMVLDAGPSPGGLESTVLDLTARPPRILRPGLISPSQIEAVIGFVERRPTQKNVALPASPGMSRRHYAPRTPLLLTPPNGEEKVVQDLLRLGMRVAWISFSPRKMPASVYSVILPGSPRQSAEKLYDILHLLDQMGLNRIVVSLPPEEEDWLAIRDRLIRAAAGNGDVESGDVNTDRDAGPVGTREARD